MVYAGWIGLFLGLASRVFLPWLNARRLNPEEAQWNWRYIWPQVIAVVIAILLLPLVVQDLESVGEMSVSTAYIVGWFAGDVGRFVDKFITKS